MLQHDVAWWNSDSLMAACVYSGCSDHILASRCHSSLVPNVFMLTLSSGIGLQRSYWKWFHSIFKEEGIYPFDCYLLTKYSLFQFSKKVPLKLNYSRVIGKGLLGELITVIQKRRFRSSTPFSRSHTCPWRPASEGTGKVTYLLNFDIWFLLRRCVFINTDLFVLGTTNN